MFLLSLLLMGNIFASYNIISPSPRYNFDDYKPTEITVSRTPVNPVVPTTEELMQLNESPYLKDIPLFRNPTIQNNSNNVSSDLLKKDIEDLLKEENITYINGKKINFGDRGLRDKNSNYGSKNSKHFEIDPHTGFAAARDISIEKGTDSDYEEFRRILLNNPRVVSYMKAKKWGIINELTRDILKESKGTGRHFHFGPDVWAVNTWNHWTVNPNIPITENLRHKPFEPSDGTYVKPPIKLDIKTKPTTKTINFAGIKTTNNRSYNKDKISYINERLSSLDPKQRAVILANIIEESGGDPYSTDGKYSGLIGWRGDRYSIKHRNNEQIELDNQIDHILNTLHNLDDKLSWTHGGEGSGYNSLRDAYNDFANGTTLQQINKGFTLGYVRPTGKNQSALNRLRVANQIYELIK